MAGLVAAFVGQTALVYADPTAEEAPPLMGIALQGRRIWLDNNCQACHQIYGFGGFLGPDLTNAASRISRERLETVLTVGAGQMPAWGFSVEEIDALEAFLRALDRTGVGQARRTVPFTPRQIAAALAEQTAETPPSAAARRGQERFRAVCSSCHRLFSPTPLDAFLAPDLSDVRARLSDAELEKVLVEGRPARGMPAWELGDEPRAEVVEYLDWLAENRAALLERLSRGTAGAERAIPWFEFR